MSRSRRPETGGQGVPPLDLKMTDQKIERVQAYLRRPPGTERIRIVAPNRAGVGVEVATGDGVIGTLHRDAENGEVS